ncbi:hypothetical protein WA158_001821 [Blastocystis sp. Blastoise]
MPSEKLDCIELLHKKDENGRFQVKEYFETLFPIDDPTNEQNYPVMDEVLKILPDIQHHYEDINVKRNEMKAEMDALKEEILKAMIEQTSFYKKNHVNIEAFTEQFNQILLSSNDNQNELLSAARDYNRCVLRLSFAVTIQNILSQTEVCRQLLVDGKYMNALATFGNTKELYAQSHIDKILDDKTEIVTCISQRFKYIHNEIKTQGQNQLKAILKQCNYPLSETSQERISSEQLDSLKSAIDDIIIIQEKLAPSTLEEESPLKSTDYVFEVLLSSFTIRFQHHFLSEYSQVSFDKPDIYFDWVYTLMNNNISFLSSSLFPLLVTDRRTMRIITEHYIQLIYKSLQTRVYKDLNDIIGHYKGDYHAITNEDAEYFLNMLKEANLFEKKLSSLVDISIETTDFSIMNIFMEDKYFSVWLSSDLLHFMSITSSIFSFKEEDPSTASILLPASKTIYIPNYWNTVPLEDDERSSPTCITLFLYMLSQVFHQLEVLNDINKQIEYFCTVYLPLLNQIISRIIKAHDALNFGNGYTLLFTSTMDPSLPLENPLSIPNSDPFLDTSFSMANIYMNNNSSSIFGLESSLSQSALLLLHFLEDISKQDIFINIQKYSESNKNDQSVSSLLKFYGKSTMSSISSMFKSLYSTLSTNKNKSTDDAPSSVSAATNDAAISNDFDLFKPFINELHAIYNTIVDSMTSECMTHFKSDIQLYISSYFDSLSSENKTLYIGYYIPPFLSDYMQISIYTSISTQIDKYLYDCVTYRVVKDIQQIQVLKHVIKILQNQIDMLCHPSSQQSFQYCNDYVSLFGFSKSQFMGYATAVNAIESQHNMDINIRHNIMNKLKANLNIKSLSYNEIIRLFNLHKDFYEEQSL